MKRILNRASRLMRYLGAGLINCYMIVRLLVPMSAWAHNPSPPDPPQPPAQVNNDTGACGNPSGNAGGGDSGDGKTTCPTGGAGGSSCTPSGAATVEDEPNNDDDSDPVILGRLSTYMEGNDVSPIRQPGGLKTATVAFGRFYTSDGNFHSALGSNWTHNYNIVLQDNETYVRIITWNGGEKVFVRNYRPPGGFLPAGYYWTGDGSAQLFKSGTNFVWKLRHGTEFVFDGLNSYRLASMTDRVGGSVTLTYSGNLLTNVADTHGRTLGLFYNGDGSLASVLDPLNRTTSYGYDGSKRLTSVSDALGLKSGFSYDGSTAWINSVTNARGKVHSYVYDDVGKVTSETNALGFFQNYDRDDVARTVQVKDWAGNVSTRLFNERTEFITWTNTAGVMVYERDANGRATNVIDRLGYTNQSVFTDGGCACGVSGGIVKAIDPLGRVNQWEYETDFNQVLTHTNGRGKITHYGRDLNGWTGYGHLTSLTDALTNVSTFLYDTPGNLTHAIDALSQTNRFYYDSMGNRTTATDALGRGTAVKYDLAGRATNVLDALNRPTGFIYDTRNRVARTINALGFTNSIGYDGVGRVTAATNALGQTSSAVYDDGGHLAFVTPSGYSSPALRYGYDANGNRTAVTNALNSRALLGYDALGQMTVFTNAVDGVWTFGYDSMGRRTNEIAPGNRTNSFVYDAAGQLITVVDAAGNPVKLGYDKNGNRIGVTNALNQFVTYGYDELDRLTSITNSLQKISRLDYDPTGHRTQTIDPNNHTNRLAYDAAGQLIAFTNALSQAIRFQYDLAGNLTNLIDGRNNAVGFGYDALNRRTRRTYAANDVEQFGYNAIGSLTNYITRAGQTNQFSYDGANRLTRKEYLGASDVMEFGYNAVGQMTNAFWRLGTTSTNSVVSFAYDAGGRLTNETQRITTATAKSVGYEYDVAGRRTKLVYPDATFLTYDYNANGQLTAIRNGGTNAIVTYEYDAAGRRTKKTLENYTFTVLDYDNAGQVTNIWNRRTYGGVTNTLSQYQYGYDDAGNRTWVKRANGKGDVYKYDGTDQLTNVVYEATNPDTTPTAATNEVRYVFDEAGNRTSVTSTNSGTTSYVPNALNQYTNVGGTTMKYDANGNPTNVVGQASSLSLSYDRENRLTRADTGTIAVTNIYDCFNRLIERGTAAGKLRFIYDDQWRVLAEYDGSEVNTAKFVYGPEIDEPVRLSRGVARYYYHQAALGTVTEITGKLGAINESYSYDVYGTPTIYNASGVPQAASSSLIQNRFLFQGRDRDPDTGLYNFRYRYYSPTMGRFLQVDPTREDGGINLYGFVANNATRFADAFGLGWWADFKCRFWPLFFRPPGGSGSPKPSGPNPSGGGTVVDVSGGGFYGVGGTAGSQVLRLDDGTVSSYLYGGFGIGTPGWSGSVQGGRVFDVHVPSDYAGPFINVSGGAFGGGGSYSFWPGGSSSVTGGFATPGISVSFQYYVQPPSVESLFWWPPYSPRPVLRISLPQ